MWLPCLGFGSGFQQVENVLRHTRCWVVVHQELVAYVVLFYLAEMSLKLYHGPGSKQPTRLRLEHAIKLIKHSLRDAIKEYLTPNGKENLSVTAVSKIAKASRKHSIPLNKLVMLQSTCPRIV